MIPIKRKEGEMLEAVIFENKKSVGTFSVEGNPEKKEKGVEISVVSNGIAVVAQFFFKKDQNPKICQALDALAKAMLEEGAEEAQVVAVGKH